MLAPLRYILAFTVLVSTSADDTNNLAGLEKGLTSLNEGLTSSDFEKAAAQLDLASVLESVFGTNGAKTDWSKLLNRILQTDPNNDPRTTNFIAHAYSKVLLSQVLDSAEMSGIKVPTNINIVALSDAFWLTEIDDPRDLRKPEIRISGKAFDLLTTFSRFIPTTATFVTEPNGALVITNCINEADAEAQQSLTEAQSKLSYALLELCHPSFSYDLDFPSHPDIFSGTLNGGLFFRVAHELGHILARHKGGKTTWRHEVEADLIAVGLFSNAFQAADLVHEPRVFEDKENALLFKTLWLPKARVLGFCAPFVFLRLEDIATQAYFIHQELQSYALRELSMVNEEQLSQLLSERNSPVAKHLWEHVFSDTLKSRLAEKGGQSNRSLLIGELNRAIFQSLILRPCCMATFKINERGWELWHAIDSPSASDSEKYLLILELNRLILAQEFYPSLARFNGKRGQASPLAQGELNQFAEKVVASIDLDEPILKAAKRAALNLPNNPGHAPLSLRAEIIRKFCAKHLLQVIAQHPERAEMLVALELGLMWDSNLGRLWNGIRNLHVMQEGVAHSRGL